MTCSSLQTLFLAGERLDPDTYDWASEQLGIPVVDHWWQTETGWPIAANLRGLEPHADQARLADGAGAGLRRADPGRRRHDRRRRRRRGDLHRLPLPPGTSRRSGATTSATSTATCRPIPGYYLTGDGGYLDDDGYLFVLGRTDDVMNVAGHRLSSGPIEAVLAGAPGGRRVRGDRGADALKGQVPRALVVVKSGDGRPRPAAPPSWSPGSASEVGPIASLRGSTWSPACPRPGRARSCARPCASSPTVPGTVPSTIEDVGARGPSAGAAVLRRGAA